MLFAAKEEGVKLRFNFHFLHPAIKRICVLMVPALIGGAVAQINAAARSADIDGHGVLARSGLAIVADYTNLGAAICKIEGTGCPASDCLTCAAPSYWSYWHLKGGSWIYAQQGSSNYRLHDGDVGLDAADQLVNA